MDILGRTQEGGEDLARIICIPQKATYTELMPPRGSCLSLLCWPISTMSTSRGLKDPCLPGSDARLGYNLNGTE